MFVSPPQMFTCTGTESTKAEQVKRFCIDGTSCDLFQKAGNCASACTQTCVKGPGGKNVCSAKSCKDPSGKVWSNPITVFLHNKMEAANSDAESGVTTYGIAPPANGITALDNGDWVQMNDVQFGTAAGAIKTAVATTGLAAAGNFIDVRVDSLTGPLLGSIALKAYTGTSSLDQTGALTTAGLTGFHPVFFKFRGGSNMGMVSYLELK
jgi:hypothetical protein